MNRLGGVDKCADIPDITVNHSRSRHAAAVHNAIPDHKAIESDPTDRRIFVLVLRKLRWESLGLISKYGFRVLESLNWIDLRWLFYYLTVQKDLYIHSGLDVDHMEKRRESDVGKPQKKKYASQSTLSSAFVSIMAYYHTILQPSLRIPTREVPDPNTEVWHDMVDNFSDIVRGCNRDTLFTGLSLNKIQRTFCRTKGSLTSFNFPG